MDFSESTKVVYDKIQQLEPENVSKIIGHLLLQDHGEQEMIRLAFSPDNLIESMIKKAKIELGLSPKSVISALVSPPQANPALVLDVPLQFNLFSPALSRPFSSPATFWAGEVLSNQQPVRNLEFFPVAYSEDRFEPVNVFGPDSSSNYYYLEPALGQIANRRSPSLPEFPVKVCHYFSKGFCRHGSSCRYFHSRPMPERFSKISNPSSNEIFNEDHAFPPGSLEKLEMELIEILRSRRGFPVSIASLPTLYYEKYGMILRADRYLTESQRHGNIGYSLTTLLARLKNSIRLLDRPHGQNSVILVEDIPRYIEYNGEKNEYGAIVTGSRQIYLTFPAESIFTEQDVLNYFKKYGPVQNVRIPCQQQRMFGFVTFVFVETVAQVLANGNPHPICRARVVVKPYREKSKLFDRKYLEKIQHPDYYASHFPDPDSEIHPLSRVCNNSRLLTKQLMEEHEQALELARRNLVELQLAAKPFNNQPYIGHALDELKLSKVLAEKTELPSTSRISSPINYAIDVLNNGSTSEEKIRHINTSCSDQESNQELNLPDSPFASPMLGDISTAI